MSGLYGSQCGISGCVVRMPGQVLLTCVMLCNWLSIILIDFNHMILSGANLVLTIRILIFFIIDTYIELLQALSFIIYCNKLRLSDSIISTGSKAFSGHTRNFWSCFKFRPLPLYLPSLLPISISLLPFSLPLCPLLSFLSLSPFRLLTLSPSPHCFIFSSPFLMSFSIS